MTPTQLSLKKLRADAYTCQVVEHWNHFAHIRQDLFGAIDILACKNSVNGCTGIQTTTTGNMTARIKKALALPEMQAFVQSGNKFLVWGWSKRGPRGKRKIWELKEHEVTAYDFIGIV